MKAQEQIREVFGTDGTRVYLIDEPSNQMTFYEGHGDMEGKKHPMNKGLAGLAVETQ